MASIQPAVYAARSFVATEPRCQSRRRARKEILDQISDLGLVDWINESPEVRHHFIRPDLADRGIFLTCADW
jgi:hypothetical protein